MKKLFLPFFLFASLSSTYCQALLEDERYVPETDPLVLQKLEQWQDIKFGLLMHWGPYAQRAAMRIITWTTKRNMKA